METKILQNKGIIGKKWRVVQGTTHARGCEQTVKFRTAHIIAEFDTKEKAELYIRSLPRPGDVFKGMPD